MLKNKNIADTTELVESAKSILTSDGFLCVDLPKKDVGGNNFFDFVACPVGSAELSILVVGCFIQHDIDKIRNDAQRSIEFLREKFGEVKAFYFTNPAATEDIFLEMNKFDIVAVGPKNLSGLAATSALRSRCFIDFDVPLLADAPASEPQLQFEEIADRLLECIFEVSSDKMPRAETQSLSVGIVGAWGSGKSTLLEILCTCTEKRSNLAVTVNPWRMRTSRHFEEALLNSLISKLRSNVSSRKYITHQFFDTFSTVSLTGLVISLVIASVAIVSFGWFLEISNIIAFFTTMFAVIAVSKLLKITDYVRDFLRQRNRIKNQAPEKLVERARILVQMVKEDNRNVCVFIDDLDRCTPSRVLEVLTAAHTLVEVGAFAFLAFDQEYVSTAIESEFGALTGADAFFGRRYLDKLISAPFYIPFIGPKEVRQLLQPGNKVEEAPALVSLSREALISITGSHGSLTEVQSSRSKMELQKYSIVIAEALVPFIVPLGLRPRDILRVSNVVKIYSYVYGFETELEIKRLCYFYISLCYEPGIILSFSRDDKMNKGPISDHPIIMAEIEKLLHPDRCNLAMYSQIFGQKI